MLLENGGDVSIPTYKGETPLQAAKSSQNQGLHYYLFPSIYLKHIYKWEIGAKECIKLFEDKLKELYQSADAALNDLMASSTSGIGGTKKSQNRQRSKRKGKGKRKVKSTTNSSIQQQQQQQQQ